MMRQRQIQLLLLIGIFIALNALGSFLNFKWDLTEEKRYTLTEPTRQTVAEVEDVIYVEVLLDGDLPAGFKRLQRSAQEMLNEFSSVNGLIQHRTIDMEDGSPAEQKARAEQLAREGVVGMTLRIRDRNEASTKTIFPYAIFKFGNRQFPVSLLESERPGVDPEVVLNSSIALLEYKFADAIQKLRQIVRPNIVFVAGHGELARDQTAFIERALQENYNTARVNLDTIVSLPQEIDLVVVAKPRTAYSDKELFVLDQYLVNGGNAIFMIDQLDVALDSLNRGAYIPSIRELNLDPLLFKYGVRLNPNLVLDLECTRIPLVVGQVGDRVQTELFPWYYHPLALPVGDHPIVKSIGRVNLKFPSSIDTVRTKADISKTVILGSSPYTRIQRVPVRLGFDILRYESDPKLYTKGAQVFGVLLEGRQLSIFENRITPEFEQQMRSLGQEFKTIGEESKIVVIADGDVAKNIYNPTTGEIAEAGYNKFENFVFTGNQDLFFNSVEYMLDDNGVIEARSKEVTLRMLDTVKAETEKRKWQLINVVLPLVVVIFGAWLFNFVRRKRFAV